MESIYKIIWTDESLENLSNIIDYLEQRWTEKEIRKFSRLLNRQINLIQSNPLLFPKSTTSGKLRKSVLSKQTTIYHCIDNKEIRIVTLYDNRQDHHSLNNH
ncbi:MAG: type II toxin-antitoxin system RelE/ParE family toxin [Bacteroidales bacterium]